MTRLIVGLVVVLVLGTSGRSNGAGTFEENYESYPVGFVYSSPTQTPPSPWVNIGNQGNSATATVVLDPLSLFGNSLHFDDDDSSHSPQFRRSFADVTNIQFSFYMLNANSDYEGTFVWLRGAAGNDVQLTFGNVSGGLGQKDKIAVLKDTGWGPVVLDFKVNTWYHVIRTLDTSIDSTLASSGTFYVAEVDSITGNDILTTKGVSGTWNEIYIGSFAANTSITSVNLATSGSQLSDSYVDNLSVEAIPEPDPPEIRQPAIKCRRREPREPYFCDSAIFTLHRRFRPLH